MITSHIQRVTTEAFLIIIRGMEGGMTILFQMKTGKIQLLHRLDFFWSQGSLGTIGYGAYLIILCMPGEQDGIKTVIAGDCYGYLILVYTVQRFLIDRFW